MMAFEFVSCPRCGLSPIAVVQTGGVKVCICPGGHQMSLERLELAVMQGNSGHPAPAGTFSPEDFKGISDADKS